MFARRQVQCGRSSDIQGACNSTIRRVAWFISATVRRSRYQRLRSRSRPVQEIVFSRCRLWAGSAEPGPGPVTAATPVSGRPPGLCEFVSGRSGTSWSPRWRSWALSDCLESAAAELSGRGIGTGSTIASGQGVYHTRQLTREPT
jgi:hypothetical protein